MEKRKSYIVSFIGMDGSGKTSTSNKLMKYLKSKGIKTKYIYLGRGRNNILPIQYLGKMFRNQSSIETDKKKNSSNIKKTKNSILHTLSSPIFALDLILRYFFILRPLKKKYDIILTDRFTSDILLMNKVPMWIKKILYMFIPKPEVVIYLYNDVNILFDRKGHPLKDLRRQEKIFKEICRTVKPIKIKTDDETKSFYKLIDKLQEKVKLNL